MTKAFREVWKFSGTILDFFKIIPKIKHKKSKIRLLNFLI